MFDYMCAFLFRSGFAHADNVITKRCSKTITWLLLPRFQGNKPHSPEPSGTFRNLPPEPTPTPHTGTLPNLATPEPSGTFWNLPPEPAPATRTGTHQSLSGLKTPLAFAVGEKINSCVIPNSLDYFLLAGRWFM